MVKSVMIYLSALATTEQRWGVREGENNNTFGHVITW